MDNNNSKIITLAPQDYVDYPWTLNHTTIWARRITAYNTINQMFNGTFFRSLEGVEIHPGDILQLGVKAKYNPRHNKKDFFFVTQDFSLERITRGRAVAIILDRMVGGTI